MRVLGPSGNIRELCLMPRYEYECENGHKTLVRFPFGDNLPPNELFCGALNSTCWKMLKRQYSTFSFTMS